MPIICPRPSIGCIAVIEMLEEMPEKPAPLPNSFPPYCGATPAFPSRWRYRRSSAKKGANERPWFLTGKLRERPSLRGYQRLLEMELHRVAPGNASDHFHILKELISSLLKDRPVYQCRQCGFPAERLHWQCPGCKDWSTVKPIQGVEGE
uniref:LapB rubredoxin metal binding domain-containing protein n=1 Tax=Candidatus Kentrum eta TaxID=2126337 RepID=A0A450VXA7_9GAMM|nr:MAG: hypothetical protein BECKH772B_GA0070898_105871 [Candidatus Kentron sp. H]VFK05998.1 MAG: hypothetical protein BECKH772A_GA0070896_106051 [Candidatus Kentron sp. H]VFK09385.1 MAG: hypothetical protein BECKH772C_GA0070978_106011 [Candidatus Kentron sp. H]